MEWLGPALVLYVAVAATLVARRRLVQIASLRVTDVAALVRAIRSDKEDDLAAAHASARVESFESLVVSALVEGATPTVRVATVNEHLGDLDRALDSQRDVPKVIARAALLCGTLGSVLELTVTVATPTGPAWMPASASFVLGLTGFLAALQIDRRARELSALAWATASPGASPAREQRSQGRVERPCRGTRGASAGLIRPPRTFRGPEPAW